MEGDTHTLEVIATFFELPRDGMTTDVHAKRLEWAMTLRRLGTSLAEAEALIRKNAELMNGYLTRIDELEIGLDEAVKVVRQNAGTISASRVRIAELESQIIHQTGVSACRIEERERLQAQIADLKRIAVEERARYLEDFIHEFDPAENRSREARRQLSEEHPEAFR